MKFTKSSGKAVPQAAVEATLEALAKVSDCGLEFLRQTLECVERPANLDLQSLLARMTWLLRNAALLKPTHLATPADFAVVLLDPKPVVFGYILAHAPVELDLLERIYLGMRRSTLSADGALPDLDDLSEERILQEMKWWIVDVGLPEYYFATTPAEEIAHQIIINRMFEVQGLGSESYADLKISYASPSGLDFHWVHSRQKYLEVERRIEKQCQRPGTVCDVAVYTYQALNLYLTQACEQVSGGETFADLAPASFLARVPEATRCRYEQLWQQVRQTGALVTDLSYKAETEEHRLMLGFPMAVLQRFLCGSSLLLQRHNLRFTRKYMITTGGSEPVVFLSVYCRDPFPAALSRQIADLSLCADQGISALAWEGRLAPAVAAFADAAAAYIHQFITREEANLTQLRQRFAGNADLREVFQALQRRMDKDNYSYSLISATLAENVGLVEALYDLFAASFDPASACSAAEVAAQAERFEQRLASLAIPADEVHVLRCGLSFVKAIWRTNFFLPTKTAMAFRLRPNFLQAHDYGQAPFGVFFLVGRDFTGFHVRFKDIARGGIRILTCRTEDEYLRNADFLFEECYDLAFTQNKKNKDIPEGGAKGVILARYSQGGASVNQSVFHQYVDALLDLLVPPQPELIRDHSAEILFLGPDEGSAELMDWACEHARLRGYPYWQGFTTGKHARLGGVSHIDYGMTTAGVHQCVCCLLEAQGVAEESISKAQTGGPDGDLGGNEILISKDRTIAVVDGGGVLYDPEGLDRAELSRLARARVNSSEFAAAKLSARGFKVGIHDQNVRLPDGTVVASGLALRNGFHCDPRMQADLFVPCGGRPKSINGTNWRQLVDDTGKPRFRWIVEGANLFMTEDARLKLQEHGVLIVKDCTANKGGVISSSLEVLAGLALSEQQFAQLMTVGPDGTVPAFRQAYVEGIQQLIRAKAKAEFQILWQLHSQSGTAMSTLSDLLSRTINNITSELEQSDLFADLGFRQQVLALHVPAALVEQVGMPALLERLPLVYQQAIFARALASTLVYRYGIEPGYEQYRQHINAIRRS